MLLFYVKSFFRSWDIYIFVLTFFCYPEKRLDKAKVNFKIYDVADCTSKLTILILSNISRNKEKKQPPEVFCKKGVLRNLTKFTGKHLCQSLFFNRVAGAACNFIKKRFLHRCFPVNFAKIFKNTYFTKHLWTTASERLLGNEIWSVIKIRWGIFFFRNHAENEARRASSRPLFVL